MWNPDEIAGVSAGASLPHAAGVFALQFVLEGAGVGAPAGVGAENAAGVAAPYGAGVGALYGAGVGAEAVDSCYTVQQDNVEFENKQGYSPIRYWSTNHHCYYHQLIAQALHLPRSRVSVMHPILCYWWGV
jgi:hypothetical protein